MKVNIGVELSDSEAVTLRLIVAEGWNDKLPDFFPEEDVNSLEEKGLIEEHHEGSAVKLTSLGEKIHAAIL